MVDTDKYSHAAHHTRPLPLELVWFAEPTVDAGVQQPDHCCREGKQDRMMGKKQKSEATLTVLFCTCYINGKNTEQVNQASQRSANTASLCQHCAGFGDGSTR